MPPPSAPPPRAWWAGPIGTGLIGLALMVGGWKLSTYLPLTVREQRQEEAVEEIRRLARDEELRAKLDSYARGARGQPPYQLPGRLVFFAGLVLFVAAGVRMYRAPPPAEPAVREADGDAAR
jgi:hypothetical protein